MRLWSCPPLTPAVTCLFPFRLLPECYNDAGTSAGLIAEQTPEKSLTLREKWATKVNFLRHSLIQFNVCLELSSGWKKQHKKSSMQLQLKISAGLLTIIWKSPPPQRALSPHWIASGSDNVFHNFPLFFLFFPFSSSRWCHNNVFEHDVSCISLKIPVTFFSCPVSWSMFVFLDRKYCQYSEKMIET